MAKKGTQSKSNKQQNKAQALEAELCFTSLGWDDYQHWVDNDRDVLERLNRLIKETRKDPFKGIGKPEPLKGDFTGYWSRRITGDHRLIYLYKGGILYIVMCRYHYAK